MLIQLPTTLNGGDVVAASHTLGESNVQFVDLIVHAPHLCNATDDPERVYVVALHHRLGSTEWGQGLYDFTFQRAKAELQKRNGWVLVTDHPLAWGSIEADEPTD